MMFRNERIEALLARWTNEARLHENAGETPGMTSEEELAHTEVARVYRECARQLNFIRETRQ